MKQLKNLLLLVALLVGGYCSWGQSQALTDIVRANTLSPTRVANAIEVMEPYTASGTDTYTVSIMNGVLYAASATYVTGDMFAITFTNANTSTTVTININSEGAIAIKDNSGSDPGVGDIVAGGTYLLTYNGTNFRIVGATGGGGGTPGGSDTQVQYNDAGAFGGDAGLVFNETTNVLTAGGVNVSGLTASEIVATDGSKNLQSLAVATYPSLTELSYVKGTTSAVQTQMDLKSNELLTANRQTASYVLVLTDKDSKVVEMNVASANDVTVPPNSSVAFPVGTQINVTQYGAGLTSVVAGSGVTIRSSSGTLYSPGQYSPMVLVKIDTDEWYLYNGSVPISIASGIYTPTLTNTTNVAASTAYQFQYIRVGTIVHFSGRIDIDPTSTGNTVLGISLPISSAFAAATQAAGSGAATGVAAISVGILSDATNDRLTLQYIAVDTTNQAIYVSGSYEIII